MNNNDYILTKKEEERALQDSISNPVIGKLLRYYNLSTKDVLTDLHNSVLISLSVISEKIKKDNLNSDDEHYTALVSFLQKIGTITLGLNKLESLSKNKNITKEEGKSSIDLAREKVMGE